MPYYDYKCCQCGYKFEVKMGMNEQKDPDCPHCHIKANRVFTAPSTIRANKDDGVASSSCPSCSSHACSSCAGG